MGAVPGPRGSIAAAEAVRGTMTNAECTAPEITTHDYIGPHPRNQTESSIASREEVLTVQRAGAGAILVGEALLNAGDVGRQIDLLFARCPAARDDEGA
ncbi:MAG: hypothetical protein V1790_09660 [Planctomycetota bacterium]